MIGTLQGEVPHSLQEGSRHPVVGSQHLVVGSQILVEDIQHLAEGNLGSVGHMEHLQGIQDLWKDQLGHRVEALHLPCWCPNLIGQQKATDIISTIVINSIIVIINSIMITIVLAMILIIITPLTVPKRANVILLSGVIKSYIHL